MATRPSKHKYSPSYQNGYPTVTANWIDITFPLPLQSAQPFHTHDETRHAKAIYDDDAIGAKWGSRVVGRRWGTSHPLQFVHMLDFPRIVGSAVTAAKDNGGSSQGGTPWNPHDYERTLYVFDIKSGKSVAIGSGYFAIPIP